MAGAIKEGNHYIHLNFI